MDAAYSDPGPTRTIRLLLLAAVLVSSPAARAQTVEVIRPGSPAVTLDAKNLAALPQAAVTLTYGTPAVPHNFQGPLLWDILVSTGAIDPAHHADAVRQTLRLEGADGYVAVLAGGEISPEFEGKPALLAVSLDGTPLPGLRAVVPAEHRMGRNVHDVVRLTLEAVPNTKH